MNLRFKLLLTTTGLASVSIGVAVLIGILTTKSQVEKYAQRSTEQIAYTLSQELIQIKGSLSKEARLLSDRPGTSTVYNTDSLTISGHLEEQTTLIQADWIAMTDSEGRVIGHSIQSPLKSGEEAINCTLVRDGIELGEQAGIFATKDSISTLAARGIKIGEYVQAVIILGKFVDTEMLQRITPDESTKVSVSSVGSHRVENSSAADLNSQDYIFHSKPLEIHTLTGTIQGSISAFVSKSKLAEPFQPVLTALFAAFCLTTFLAYIGAVLISTSLSRPLEALSRFARELQSGVWPDPIHKGRSDEIGQLERAFDEMSMNLKANKARLLGMLDIDPLTELLNFRAFRNCLHTELAGTIGSRKLCLLDLDHLERFNQEHGDAQGDHLLQQFAKQLSTEFQNSLALGRIGGDEFAILTCSDDFTERLRSFSAASKANFGVTFSAGIVEVQNGESRADLVMMNAEIAVSQVKNSGRNAIRFFSDALVVIENSDLEHLQKSSYGAVLALAEAVDAKDEYTRGHSNRVAHYAKDLAIAAGYEEGFVNLVYLTGTLHDVGKIGVPDAVLKKPDRLTEAEYVQIQLHPVLGEKIIRRIPELADALPGVRSHHERWDGKGYPDNLSGESIPLIARILAIADTFDAMTSDRPYRKGMPTETALRLMEEAIGTQFDPSLGWIFLEMMRSQADDLAA